MVFEEAVIRHISDKCLEAEAERRRQDKAPLVVKEAEAKAEATDREAFAVMKQTIMNDMLSCASLQDEYRYLNYVQILLSKLISADYMMWHFKEPGNPLSPNIGLPISLDAQSSATICTDHTQYTGEAKNIYLLDSPMEPDKLPKIWDRDPAFDNDEPSACLYYPCWNIGLIVHSRHRIAEAYTYAKTCPVQALIYDDWLLYGHIHTDGAYWLENGSDAPIDRICDYRIAVLFWLEAEKIRRDRDRALKEIEENKKRFIISSANAKGAK